MTNLLIWKGYHGLLHIYMPYKQNGTIKVLPPLVIPISGLAHGLSVFSLLRRFMNRST